MMQFQKLKDVRRFLGDKTVEFFDEKIRPRRGLNRGPLTL